MPTKKARIAELNETTGAICASAFRQYTTSLWSQGPNGDVTVKFAFGPLFFFPILFVSP
jgi:hypothetical protein